MKLYPLRFTDEKAEAPWGQVSYKIADLGFTDSMVAEGWFGGNTLSELMGTYLERVTGDESFEYYGLQFPVMLKVLKVTGWQPLQVNVGDEAAEERYDSFGKTALWYIQEAGPDARMYLGFNRDVPAGEFYARCQEGTVEEVLNELRPKAGEYVLIKPGTVFAAGPGLTILEIAECSEMSFNIHGWGAPDSGEILLEEAFDLIDFSRLDAGPERLETVERPEFKVTRMDLKAPLHIFSEQPGSFALYHCLSGEATVCGEDGVPRNIPDGTPVLVPSEVNDYILAPVREGTVVLEVTAGARSVPDSYVKDPHIKEWN